MPLAGESEYVQRGMGLCPRMGMSGVCPGVVYPGVCPWGTGMSGGRGIPWVLGYPPPSVPMVGKWTVCILLECFLVYGYK